MKRYAPMVDVINHLILVFLACLLAFLFVSLARFVIDGDITFAQLELKSLDLLKLAAILSFASLVMGWLFCELRHWVASRIIGAIIFGAISPMIILETLLGFTVGFDAILIGWDEEGSQRNFALLYMAMFLITAAIYVSAHKKIQDLWMFR